MDSAQAILAFLEVVTLGCCAFLVKKVVSSGETLAALLVQMKNMNAKVADHETRIRTVENHRAGSNAA